MRKVTRLPVQHPQAPFCATCEKPLPNLNGIFMSVAFDAIPSHVTIEGMTLHVRCECGSPWDLKKGIKT